LYFPWTLSIVGEIFAACPQVEWLTSAAIVHADTHGRVVHSLRAEGYHPAAFMLGRNMHCPGFANGFIMQESTFWRRSLWDRAGASLDITSPLAGDFDLWARFFKHAPLYCTSAPLAAFRMHQLQKTAQNRARYHAEALAILKRHGGRPAPWWRRQAQRLVRDLPGGGRLLGWPAPWVEFDFASNQWHTSTRIFA
jgi:hypothetical protein